jgi:DNA-binding transcriptional MerR regulator
MRIGELASRAGVTPKAVRYYEQLGLVTARRTASGYRDFDDASLDVIEMIRNAQRLGVKLAEMDEIIALIRDHKRPCASVRRLISAKRHDIAKQIASLLEFDRFLARLEGVGQSGDSICPILSTVHAENTMDQTVGMPRT